MSYSTYCVQVRTSNPPIDINLWYLQYVVIFWFNKIKNLQRVFIIFFLQHFVFRRYRFSYSLARIADGAFILHHQGCKCRTIIGEHLVIAASQFFRDFLHKPPIGRRIVKSENNLKFCTRCMIIIIIIIFIRTHIGTSSFSLFSTLAWEREQRRFRWHSDISNITMLLRTYIYAEMETFLPLLLSALLYAFMYARRRDWKLKILFLERTC